MSSNFGFNNTTIKVLIFNTHGPFSKMFLTSLLNKTTLNNVVNNTNIELKLKLKEDEDLISSTERVIKNLFDPNVPIPLDDCNPFKDSQYERDVFSTFKLNSQIFPFISSTVLELTEKRDRRAYLIEFITISGEWIDNYDTNTSGEYKQLLQDLISEAQTIMITIDSVFMLEDAGVSALKKNKVEAITKIIQENYNSRCEFEQKLITFIPLNCEKYYNTHMELVNFPDRFCEFEEDPMFVLMTQVKRVYAPLIRWCADVINRNALNLDVAILPVMTLGNIQFSHFDISRSELPNYSDMYYTYYKQFTGTYDDDFTLPEYAPKFCEQPLLYVLLHLFGKAKQFIEFKRRFDCVLPRMSAISRLIYDTELIYNIPLLRGNLVTEKDGYLREIFQSPNLPF